jgi:hypothetical protein
MTRAELRAALEALQGELDQSPLDVDHVSRCVTHLVAQCDNGASYVERKLRSLRGECTYLDGRSGDRASRLLTIRGELDMLLHYLAD